MYVSDINGGFIGQKRKLLENSDKSGTVPSIHQKIGIYYDLYFRQKGNL